MTSAEQLNIYYLTRQIPPETATWDELLECVVIAVSGQQARCLGAGECGNEGAAEWFGDTATVTLLGAAVEGSTAGVVCRDVHEA